MSRNDCHCIFPSPNEEELATIPGPTAGTALRIHAEVSEEGYVRLEQLAYNEGHGWYVQKSFVIPREILPVLITNLRKADCLMPRHSTPRPQSYLLFPDRSTHSRAG